ncbi:pathogenicity island protein [Staphylococcus lugdunensis]|mgnify:CR=1 FL=1|nr:hypothetical protein [Staphylococcus lugdunensis]EFU84257.1 hypothetical protein HMPREF0790_0884 [Staphylococcus lugdunensis M23590]MCH8639511.1 hypothetical protein [Staphylococcus lugdunensis]SQE72294.1 pathogenicity island protein [Staphylococcus lugdunensis]
MENLVSGLKNINLDRTQAHRFIKVSEEIKDVGTYQHLGLRALSEIASLPVPERTKEHITSNGETKTPDEITLLFSKFWKVLSRNIYIEKEVQQLHGG